MKRKISDAIPFERLRAEWMKDPGFHKEYEKLETEFQIACQMIGARIKKKMALAQLARRVDTGQAVISRLEGMNAKLSISLLERVARALGTNSPSRFSNLL